MNEAGCPTSRRFCAKWGFWVEQRFSAAFSGYQPTVIPTGAEGFALRIILRSGRTCFSLSNVSHFELVSHPCRVLFGRDFDFRGELWSRWIILPAQAKLGSGTLNSYDGQPATGVSTWLHSTPLN